MELLKQSTAATVKLGPFLDETDGKSAETALAIAQADIRLTKNGGAFAQSNNAAGATHDENGYYGVPLDVTDTGTLGRLRVAVSKAGALPVWEDFLVVPANVYDALVLGTDKLDANAAEIGGTVQTGRDLGASVLLAAAAVDAVLDEVVDGTYTMRQLLRGFAAVLLGKASGMGTVNGVFRDISDTKNRVAVTQDADGNRTAFGTLDLT